MKKRFGYIAVGLLCLASGYVLARLLGPSVPPPPPAGFHSKVVDSIAGCEVIEFRGTREGIDRRLRYIRNRDGTRPVTLSNLSWHIASKHGGDAGSREAAIRDFIALHNPWETLVLSSAHDIPGFSREQLDPDIRALALVQVHTPHDSQTLSVIYAWTKVGGELKRYRFKSSPGHAPYCYSCVVLQKEVGDAAYLE